MDEKLVKIKELLKDFKEVDESTVESLNTCVTKYNENPLNPDLMSYCFDKILGFKVNYRVFDKVNYLIRFDYKGSAGYVEHQKLSYGFYIDSNYKDEVLSIFHIVKEILEEYFMDNAKVSLTNNDFTMENEYFEYSRKFTFYENRVEELSNKIKHVEDEKKKDFLKNSEDTFIKLADKYNFYQEKSYKLKLEILYSIETYIDVFYSFLEHILTLLYPFTNEFDISKSYFKEYIHNPRWTWSRKIEDVFNHLDIADTIKGLREIKEIHRNRNAHGSFSRELKAYVYIKDWGRYPLYVGKEYLQGFTEEYNITLNYERFIEYKDIFNQFFDLLDKEYPIPMTFIKSAVPIPVNVEILMEGVNTIEEAEKEADRIHYELDNQLNMDW